MPARFPRAEPNLLFGNFVPPDWPRVRRSRKKMAKPRRRQGWRRGHPQKNSQDKRNSSLVWKQRRK